MQAKYASRVKTSIQCTVANEMKYALFFSLNLYFLLISDFDCAHERYARANNSNKIEIKNVSNL
ncbi:hypothetical protein EV144_101565 [Flavobacterium sp. 270]|nr:hypothetical protein EV144_101565 [Flavobacterium sp. 270]